MGGYQANNTNKIIFLFNRRIIYEKLKQAGVPVPEYAVLNRDENGTTGMTLLYTFVMFINTRTCVENFCLYIIVFISTSAMLINK